MLGKSAVTRAGLLDALAAAAAVVLLAVSGGAGAITRPAASSTSRQTSQPGSALESFPTTPEAGCNYTISERGASLVAVGGDGTVKRSTDNPNAAAFVNSMLASHEKICVSPGVYTLESEIQISRLQGVTLSLGAGTVMNGSSDYRLLLVFGSPGTVIDGGVWIGQGSGVGAGIRVLYGSNNTVVENTDVSRAGYDGIFDYEYLAPSFNVSIIDNRLHDNGRYGIQVFAKSPGPTTDTLVSGNVVLDNGVGGIYTNGVAGVTVSDNIVRNTVGNGPGDIGIGVTNASYDSVTRNQVDHMAWFGIQAFFNNHTTISDNISTSNQGAFDQSGITNDHSSFSTITGNVVESNGKFGIYVERSWNVTVEGNLASDNLEYGIGFYHGSIPVMGEGTIADNTCGSNSLGGIVLNSAVNNSISMNRCADNGGDGILLYNDPGQAGCTGNVVSDNWLGNDAGSQAQRYGIVEANEANRNVLVANALVNNTVAAVTVVGPNTTFSP